MKKRTLALTAPAILVGLIAVGVSTLQAQPPGRGGPEGRGGRGGPDGHGPPPSPVMEALDINGDHVIDAEEIKMASQSLAKLDRNGDGEIDAQELHGPPPGVERGGRPEGMRGPRDGEPRRDGPRGGDRGRGPGGPRGAAGPDGPGGPDGPDGPGGGMQDPGRFVDHAMQYDANDDGMLSRDELMAFAKEMSQHRRGAPDGGPGRGGPDRGGPDRGGPDRGGPDRGGPDRGERPDRPRRPSSDE